MILPGIIFLGLLIGNLAGTYFYIWKGHQQTKSLVYRVIPPATKGFNHSWVGWNGTLDGVFLWFCGFFYYLSYKLETKKQSKKQQAT